MPPEPFGMRRFCMLSSVRPTELSLWMTTLQWMLTATSLVRHRQAAISTSTKQVVPATCRVVAALSSRFNSNLDHALQAEVPRSLLHGDGMIFRLPELFHQRATSGLSGTFQLLILWLSTPRPAGISSSGIGQ